MTDRAVVALVWRALLAAARTPALWVAMGAQAGLYSLYLLVWGDGLPVAGAIYDVDNGRVTPVDL